MNKYLLKSARFWLNTLDDQTAKWRQKMQVLDRVKKKTKYKLVSNMQFSFQSESVKSGK